MGISAKEFLDASAYKNYRNIRAVAVMYVVLGSILTFAGTMFLFDTSKANDLPVPAALAFTVVGLTGVVGGIATRRGKRSLAWLSYVMSAGYLFAFPLGTVLSAVMLMGLSRYLADVGRLREAQGAVPVPATPKAASYGSYGSS